MQWCISNNHEDLHSNFEVAEVSVDVVSACKVRCWSPKECRKQKLIDLDAVVLSESQSAYLIHLPTFKDHPDRSVTPSRSVQLDMLGKSVPPARLEPKGPSTEWVAVPEVTNHIRHAAEPCSFFVREVSIHFPISITPEVEPCTEAGFIFQPTGAAPSSSEEPWQLPSQDKVKVGAEVDIIL